MMRHKPAPNAIHVELDQWFQKCGARPTGSQKFILASSPDIAIISYDLNIYIFSITFSV